MSTAVGNSASTSAAGAALAGTSPSASSVHTHARDHGHATSSGRRPTITSSLGGSPGQLGGSNRDGDQEGDGDSSDGFPQGDGDGGEGSGTSGAANGGHGSGKRKTPFTRSRGGCARCRTQKKRCDQTHPTCARCQAVQRPCLYPEPTVWAAVSPTRPLPTPPTQAQYTPYEHERTYVPRLSENEPQRLPQPQSLSLSQLHQHSQPREQHQHQTHHAHSHIYNTHPPQHAPPAQLHPPIHPQLHSTLPHDHLPGPAALAAPPFMPQPTDSTGGLDILGGEWSLDGDAFLQALFSMSETQNLTNNPSFPLTNPVSDVTPSIGSGRMTHDGPLSVPVDCDPSLWSFFVNTSRWEEEEPSDEERSLFEYYNKFTPSGVVIQDGPARQFFQACAARASAEKGRALMHAVLCLSAQHLSNKARTEDDRAKLNRYRDISAQHRSQALHLLRVAAADRSNDTETLPAIMILLILATILKGESGIIPSFLERTASALDRAVNPADSVFIPSVSALHSMYTSFYALSAQKQIDISSLFPDRDSRPVWSERVQGVLETVTGMRKDVFVLLLKANELVIEFNTVDNALKRDEDDELRMMRMELQARGSAMEADLEDDEAWREKYLDGNLDRTKVGHNCCRVAIRIMMLADILLLPFGHLRIQRLVKQFAEQLDACAPQLEVGLSTPYVMVASYALADMRPRFSAFISRAQWKGSAMPRIAEAVVEEVWATRDAGGKQTWRESLLARGSPIII